MNATLTTARTVGTFAAMLSVADGKRRNAVRIAPLHSLRRWLAERERIQAEMRDDAAAPGRRSKLQRWL